jgi:amino acid transporter
VTRIFNVLGGFSLVFVLLAIATGLVTLSGDIRDPFDTTAQANLRVHRLSGIGAGVAVLLVNSIVVTYFIGTSRWCREVCETYQLDASILRRSAQLKRRAFPASIVGIVTIIGIAASGAAADPMTGTAPSTHGMSWGEMHLAAAVIGMVIVGWSLVAQRASVATNHEIITDVLNEVHRIRTERGLT